MAKLAGLPDTLIEPTTSAATATVLLSPSQYLSGATFVQEGLATTETVTIKYSVDGGASWNDYYADGAVLTLTPTNVAQTLWAPMHIQVSKSTSAGVAGVYLFTAQSIGQ